MIISRVVHAALSPFTAYAEMSSCYKHIKTHQKRKQAQDHQEVKEEKEEGGDDARSLSKSSSLKQEKPSDGTEEEEEEPSIIINENPKLEEMEVVNPTVDNDPPEDEVMTEEDVVAAAAEAETETAKDQAEGEAGQAIIIDEETVAKPEINLEPGGIHANYTHLVQRNDFFSMSLKVSTSSSRRTWTEAAASLKDRTLSRSTARP